MDTIVISKSRIAFFTALLLVATALFLSFVFVVDAQTKLIPCTGVNCDFSKFIELIQNVIDFLLVSIAIPLSMILFAYAGWLYMSAAGDTGKIEQGHKIFRNVIMGLVIALAAWLIVNTIASALRGPDFDNTFFFLQR